MNPLDKLILASVKCTKCGVQGFGKCDCWPKKPAPKKVKSKEFMAKLEADNARLRVENERLKKEIQAWKQFAINLEPRNAE